ncbi:SUN domain-containing protein 2-like [Pundamilia nyererei]|uniref:SUN domain-containing protein 2-like n=1 Tax=Pundamilia nyererei TaxID=303518 RepID=A0A9Y3RSN3_9CICH|nr:PREDICTED: SUN domain-containing protein 2-like [Pundamilia nyererei]XP_005746883.1 PREDICTED: SUN domain-containing protein 2-like [Pundamilia nyererei]
MLKRSSRLQSNGYYNSTGEPVISYKERLYGVFKRRRFHFRNGEERHFEHDLEHKICTSDAEPGCGSTKRKTFLLIFLVFSFGLLFSLAVFTGISSVIVTKIFTTSSKQAWKQLEELQSELASLKEKIDFLVPVADRMPNFALESLGARIIYDKTSESYPPDKPVLRIFGFTLICPNQRPYRSPRILLEGRAPMLPGQCWAFGGSQGQISIELAQYITISHVSLGHIPQMLSPYLTVSSAPRKFSVFGNQHAEDPVIYLGTFQYNPKGGPLQTFKIAESNISVVKYVTLRIHDNWGNSQYSCIYSFRVHGKLAWHEH